MDFQTLTYNLYANADISNIVKGVVTNYENYNNEEQQKRFYTC